MNPSVPAVLGAIVLLCGGGMYLCRLRQKRRFWQEYCIALAQIIAALRSAPAATRVLLDQVLPACTALRPLWEDCLRRMEQLPFSEAWAEAVRAASVGGEARLLAPLGGILGQTARDHQLESLALLLRQAEDYTTRLVRQTEDSCRLGQTITILGSMGWLIFWW